MGRGEPLLLDEGDDELWCHQRQAEHDGERHETGETQHLGEDTTKAFEVIAHLHKGWLCHTLHHARDGGSPHRVPLVGLGVSTHLHLRVNLTQHEREDVVIHLIEDAGDEHLGGESKHFTNGGEEGKDPLPKPSPVMGREPIRLVLG